MIKTHDKIVIKKRVDWKSFLSYPIPLSMTEQEVLRGLSVYLSKSILYMS